MKGAFINAALCAANVGFYVGGGRHWWSAVSAVFCGLGAVIVAIDAAARQR